MIAFFCATPYQILLAINMKFTIHKNNPVDIYILDHFEDADETVKRLNFSKVFNKAELINSTKFISCFSEKKTIRLIQKTKNFLGYKNIIKKYFDFGDVSYEEIYLTYPDVIIQLAIKELYDRNSEIKIHMYEDGTGGYSSEIIGTSIYKKIFNQLSGFGKSIDIYDSIMVFKPELYSGITDIPIVKIPPINIFDEELKEKINYVFAYHDAQRIDEKVIFLEQPIDYISGLNEKIKDISRNILKTDYIIKLHPRSNTTDYDGYNTHQFKGMPWEVLSLNSNIEDKILISYYSTASISNKMIFDKEPIIIFLYDMDEFKSFNLITQDARNFIEKFQETYRDPSRILLAKNTKEFKDFISKYEQS